MRIFHIASRQAWLQARPSMLYASPSLASEGFIHCSTRIQVVPVARKFYTGQKGLVLLEIDPGRLTAILKWEPPSDGVSPPGVAEGEAFPHIYGPINADAVVKAWDFEPDANGEFTFPAAMMREDSDEAG